jgi:hypothetical protein
MVSVSKVQDIAKEMIADLQDRGIIENREVIASALTVLKYMETSSEVAKPREMFQETFAEWATRYSLNSHNDRFLVSMYYLLERENLQIITSDHILGLYKKARWEVPQNPADTLAKAAKRKFVTEDGGEEGKKSWRITKTGFNHIQSLTQENHQ